MKTTDKLITLNAFSRRILTLLSVFLSVLAFSLGMFFWRVSHQAGADVIWFLVLLTAFLVLGVLALSVAYNRVAVTISRPIAHLIANTQVSGRPGPPPLELVTRIAEIDILSRSIRHILAKSLSREHDVIGNEKRLSLALRGSGEGVWDWNIQENSSYIDANCCAILNVTPEEVENDNRAWIKWLHPDDKASAKNYFRRAATGSLTAFEEEYRILRPGVDGDSWLQLRGSVVEWNIEGLPTRMSGTVSDVTRRKSAEQQLKLYSMAFKCTKNAVVMLDKNFCVLAVNRAFTQVTGEPESRLAGQQYCFQHQAMPTPDFYNLLKQQVNHRAEWHGEALGQRPDGSSYPQELAVYGVFDDYKNLTHYVAIFSDITERKRTEENLRTLANYDPLTGLANRYMFNATLTRSLQSAARKSEKLAVLFIDLDYFKQVNDLLGHEIGDRLLISVAGRIEGCIRKTDTAARLAGDEFVIILENIQSIIDVEQVAEKILGVLPESSREYAPDLAPAVSASIGISLFPEHGDNPESLLRSADRAMYNAKTLGRNRLYFCTQTDKFEAS